MILLENGLPGSLPILQVSFQSYVPSEKIHLSWTTRCDFFRALNMFFLNCADYFMKEMGPFSEIFANLESMNRAVSNALVESAKVYIKFLLFIFLITYNVRVLDVGFI